MLRNTNDNVTPILDIMQNTLRMIKTYLVSVGTKK